MFELSTDNTLQTHAASCPSVKALETSFNLTKPYKENAFAYMKELYLPKSECKHMDYQLQVYDTYGYYLHIVFSHYL